MYSDSNDIVEVDLLVIPPDGTCASLREALLFTGYGIPHQTTSGSTTKHQVKHNCTKPCQKLILFFQYAKKDDVTLFKNHSNFKENKDVQVIITHVNNPEDIYIQKVSSS